MQLPLFDVPTLAPVRFPPKPTAPFQPHSEPSREAAEQIKPHLGELQIEVLEQLARIGAHGWTDHELIAIVAEAKRLPEEPNTVRPRRIELVRLGFVIDSGRTRKTRSGRKATVWTITPEGRAALGKV